MTKLCPRGKAAAKRKFRVYPSAYANAYASKICAGKIKDPSGVKRKDFKGPKPAGKAMGGRIGYQSGKIVKKTKVDEKTIRKEIPVTALGEIGVGPPLAAKAASKVVKSMMKKRENKMGGGLMAATERLKRQGLKRGGGVCKRGMNRQAIGKNS